MMEDDVHGTEAWLPHCMSDEDSRAVSMHGKGSPLTSPVSMTYTQLTTVNSCQSSTSAAILSGVKQVNDVVALSEQNAAKDGSHLKRLRPHSTPATLLWLEQNFEMAEGVCIPRSTLYMYYVDFCQRNNMQPVNAASFGKIIRQQFPHLTTRRLGTRGQSRYHYYGIAVRDTSQYYDVTYSKKGGGCANGHEHKKEPLKVAAHSQRTKINNILPDFSYFRELKMPPNMSEEKVSTFLMMYRTHCQRLIDAVMRASFDEVQSFLLHFWKGIPSHISSILACNAVINMIGVCDSFVYKAISTVLFPTIHQALPESLTQMVRQFARDLTLWLRVALDDVNLTLRDLKIDLAKCFSRTLRRQTSLNHLCQASRVVLHTPDLAMQMLQDWKNVDLDGISRQILYTMDGQSHIDATLELITNLYREFETILEDQAPIEACMEWLESLIERCVVQPSRKCRSHSTSLRRFARQFLLMWSSFGSRVIRDMTLHSAPSFGSFHLLHLTFDDYVLFLVESIHWEERTQELFANIPNDAPPTLGEHLLDDAVVDPTVGITKLKWFNSVQQQQQPQQLQKQQGNEVNENMLPVSISPSSSSSSSHNSSTEIFIRHQSPSSLQSQCAASLNEVIRDDESEVPENGESLLETDNEYGAEHYGAPTGYHYVNGDSRANYNFVTPPQLNTQIGHKKYSTTCHTHNNQYANPNTIGIQSSPRASTDPLNNSVEYLNFGQYQSASSSVRRSGDYNECHVSYVYDQQQQSPVAASPVIYSTAPSANTCNFYPPPPAPPSATPVYSGGDNGGAVCCPPPQSPSTFASPRYSMGSPKERHQLVTMVDVKIQPEDLPPTGIAYSVTSLGNGRP